jgi:coenzyme F420-0:L-glutamate ligase/coenzyme F420-1:gamma-L-glutamate ligase
VNKKPLMVIPVTAPVQQSAFDLVATLSAAIRSSGETLQDGDIVAVSSKYTAISEGRIVKMDEVQVSAEAQAIAGLDRSNIPNGFAVLFPEYPYRSAEQIRQALQKEFGVKLGVILTDSWLMPGRLGTTGVALATAGFHPIQDERGKIDLFGNPMQVTQRGIADTICAAAELVMGERDEATPIAIVRNTEVPLLDLEVSEDDVSIPWHECIYVQSLTAGLLEQTPTAGD